MSDEFKKSDTHTDRHTHTHTELLPELLVGAKKWCFFKASLIHNFFLVNIIIRGN